MTRVVLLFAILAALGNAMTAAAGSIQAPLLLGIDNAGSDWRYKSDCPLADDPHIGQALRELGVNFMVYHFDPVWDHGSDNSALTARRVATIDGAMRRLGLKYTLNNELSNWYKSAEIDPGVNEFAHPDGTHRWDLRMDWLDPVFPPRKGGEPALVGITYDECEHMQLTGNQFAIYPDEKPFDRPFLVDTAGKDLETAYNRLVAKCKQLRTTHYRSADTVILNAVKNLAHRREILRDAQNDAHGAGKGRLTLATEQVWPDLFHIFARAGWTITPKILKENLSSVVMAISLGAALEYQDVGANWWVSPDLWCLGNYPGHSPQALRSALMMGYWLGADALYVENLDFPTWQNRHPLAPPKGSLIAWNDDGSYELTSYGEVVRDFYTRYIPEHPRKHTWRDYRPRVAIVRLPDGAWGQRGTMFRDRLLGNPDHPMDEISAEWLDIWPILTHGVARPGAISINNPKVYPEYPWPFFVPIDSVAVFDHLVTGPVLDSIECFIVCGHALSERTFDDIARRVQRGATCIISRRLYDAHKPRNGTAPANLPGKWLIVDSFTDPAIAAALKPVLGPPDVARFRFKDFTIDFRVPGSDRDAVDVSVTAGESGNAISAFCGTIRP